jgi:CubicO group peptidase (beta-lactamase class C family)
MTAGFDPAGNYTSKVSVPQSETWRWLLERPMKYPPGTHFDYDEAEQNLLSIVLTRAIKQDAGAFAERNLFAPLHIVDHHWVSEADGYLLGATGLFLTGRDMAKIGLLYLQRGRWSENQIVSDAFVADSTTKHNEGGPPSHAAYGYFWWTKQTKAGLDAFFAAGHNSQLIYVVPERDLVAAVAAEKIPGGSVGFVNDLVLPAEAELPASAPCVARFEQEPAE